jgi:hypothetical protein
MLITYLRILCNKKTQKSLTSRFPGRPEAVPEVNLSAAELFGFEEV